MHEKIREGDIVIIGNDLETTKRRFGINDTMLDMMGTEQKVIEVEGQDKGIRVYSADDQRSYVFAIEDVLEAFDTTSEKVKTRSFIFNPDELYI